MYLAHYGLRELPFTLTPNTAFFLNQGCHREALNVLLVALRSGEGFIKISGEVGTGKTLLCRQLLNMLEAPFVTAYIPNPVLDPQGLRLALADELGVDSACNRGQHRLLQALTERLLELCRQGRRVVLIVDEAQAMPEETLEALRLLTNLETEQEKLLQVVMFGQPELDARLAGNSLRQLRQRIGFGYTLQPLRREVLPQYLQFRLQAAGYSGEPVFARAAVELIYRGSRGVPRLVNILAHKSLLAAFGEGRRRVGGAHARRALIDTEDARAGLGWSWPLRRLFAAGGTR